MTPEPEQDEFRRRAIRAVLVVAGIAAVIGLVIGGLTSAAVNLSGVLPKPTATPTLSSSEPSDDDALPTPSLAPTPSRQPSQAAPPSRTPTPTTSPRPTKAPSNPSQAITLTVTPKTVDSYQRVTLSGRYPAGNGTSLQVQRRQGGQWAPFPTSASVNGGAFSTYVESGQSGPNAFRVVDHARELASNVVVVTIS